MSEDAMEISSLMAAAAAATKPVIATATKPSAVVPGSSVVKKKELHMEKCLLMQEEINIPIAMIENTDVFSEVLSQNTWQNVLSESQRKHLMKFLPSFPQNDLSEKQNTLRQAFGGESFNFGNPLEQFQTKLRDGMFSPDIAKYAALYRKARVKEYRYQQQVYYTKLIKQLLFSRQRVMDQVNKTGIDEPWMMEMMKYQPPPKEKSLDTRVRRRYLKLLREISEECGEDQISSEDEEGGQAVSLKNRKLPGKPSSPTSHLEGAPCRVLPTFAQRMHLPNGDLPGNSHKTPITEDDLRNMLRKHRKRRHDSEETPDLDTRGLTLQDIFSRAQPLKKSLIGRGGMPFALKRKFKDKPDKVKRKLKVEHESGEDMVLPAGGEIPQDENAMDGLDETDEALAGLIGEDPTGSVASAPSFNQCGSFFSLIRDLICDDSEAKVSTMKLEEKVREWQETSAAAVATWYRQQPSWVDLVLPGLKFLSGDVLGLTLENFIPYVDYKERAQQWKWIGQGRDTDEQLQPLYKHWLEHKDEASLSSSDQTSSSPPPPRHRTTHVVRPSSEEEKDIFREQEEQRFRNANRGFTYHMHGYESVVGPVKGVYANDSQATKARDHALLVRDRPAYVTILTLVRDAAARLPNGEGTRSDICELLKDSQFLAPGVTDAQINTVVSGALDRLHYEKDPCVKYDVNRKLWIYLHRNRTEEEFERIHQAQGAAAKAKKALQKPKPAKKLKDPAAQSMQAALKAVTATTPVKPTLDLSKSTSPAASVVPDALSVGSPCTPQQSPRGAFGSPRSAQSSPKVLMSGVPVSPSMTGPRGVAAGNLSVTGPRTMTANPKSVAAMVQQLNSPKTLSLAQGKPVSLTLLQAQETLKSQTSLSTSSQSPVSAAGPVMTAAQLGNKPLAFSLIQSASNNKPPEAVPQTKVMLTSRAETVAQKLAASSQAAQQAAQIQLVTSQNRATVASSLLTTQARPLSATVAGGTPVVAKLVQQGITPQQVVTIGSTAAGTLKPTVTQATTTIKIQGTKSRSTTTHAGTPVTLQRAHSIDAAAVSRSATPDARTTAILQRLQSADGTEIRSMPVSAEPVTMVAGNQQAAKPMAQVSLGRGGKPATLLITKPGGTPGTKAGVQQIAGSVSLSGNETVAQLIQTSAMAGKQAMIGGKPILIGGKPAMLAGKPIHIGGKPLQLIGKAGLGVLQAQGGLVSALNMVSQASGVTTMTTTTPTTRVISHNQASLVGQILPQGGATLLQQQMAQKLGKSAPAVVPAQVSMATAAAAAQLQTKIVTPGQGGIMVTQLPNQGKQRGTSTASSNAPKLLHVTQAGLLGSQLLVQPTQPTQSQAKVVGSQVLTAAGGIRPAAAVRPGLVASQTAKSNPNIQVVKTMLSQPSGKPAQTTIVLAQPGTQSIMATGLTPEQLSQAGVRPVATTGSKGKAGPVYARIITPPPNIRLVRPGQMASMPGVSVLQAVGQLPADATQILTQLPIATAAQPPIDKAEEPEVSQ